MAALRRIAALALGAATLSAAAQHAAVGGYTPVSNVIEHTQIVYDVAAITAAVGAGDYAAAKAIYTGGQNSCKSPTSTRPIQGFVTQATYEAKLKGTAFGCSFFSGPCGPATADLRTGLGAGRLGLAGNFWDTFILSALDGTGDFAGLSETMRKTAVKKGVLGIITMYIPYELETAITMAVNNETADAQAPHAWDEGWGFYYGAFHPIAGAATGAFSPWEFTKKRDLDFCWDAADQPVSGAAVGTTKVLEYFMQGEKAARAGDVDTMVAARNNIYRVFALSSIRAALKYSEQMLFSASGEYRYSDEYHMEAYTYFLAAAGWVEQASPNAGKDVLALLDFKRSYTASDSTLFCQVRAKLIAAYASLGLDCDLVGEWKSHNAASTTTCSAFPAACPDVNATMPAGETGYAPTDSTAPVGSNMDCGSPFITTTVTTTPVVVTSGALSATAGAALALAALSSLLFA